MTNTFDQGHSRAYLLPCDVRAKDHIPRRKSKKYGSDKSRKITYYFNSAGYRSEELDTSATFRICVCGESNAFGTGVAFESTFGQRLKLHYCTALGLPAKSVNIINLSVGGTSVDYSVRTLIRQIDGIRPDLVIAHFSKCDRIENLDWKTVMPYVVSGIALDKLEKAPIAFQGFCDFYSEPFGLMNTVRNALLLQSMCQLRNIDFIISSTSLIEAKYQDTISGQLYAHLDQENLLSHEGMFKVDQASDGRHAGPRSHEILSIALLDKYATLAYRRSKGELTNQTQTSRIAQHAVKLKTANPDWATVMENPLSEPLVQIAK